jgi:putative FmdB family regulatory protein
MPRRRKHIRCVLISASKEGSAVPNYEYRCRRCGEVFEHAEHISEHDSAHPQCPKCESDDVERVLTPFYAKTSKKS